MSFLSKQACAPTAANKPRGIAPLPEDCAPHSRVVPRHVGGAAAVGLCLKQACDRHRTDLLRLQGIR